MSLTGHIVRACRELTTKIIAVSEITSRHAAVRSKNKLVWICFPIIFTASLFLFYPSLNYYFFQDDWFVLNWVRTDEFLSFFTFRTDIIYWRPLSMPIFFWINYKIFGLNPWGFHLVSFSIFLLLLIVVFKLFKLLTGETKISLWLVFLYAIWPIHFISLSWLATTSYIIATFFMIGSLFFWIKGVEIKNKKYLYLAYITFLLGLLSHEMVLILPILLVIWGFIFKKANYLKMVLPMLAIDTLFMITRLWISPVHAEGDYAIAFGTRTLLNFSWYILWAFNFPERFKELVQPSIPVLSLKVFSQIWGPASISSAGLLIFAVLMVKNFKKYGRQLIFCFLLFIFLLFSFLLTPKHTYPLYLSFAGIGLLYLIWLTVYKSRNIYKIIFSLIWIIASVANLQFTRLTHWVVNQQTISKAYVNYTIQKHPNVKPSTVFLISDSSIEFNKVYKFTLVESEKQVKQSLNDQEAFKVKYNDSSLITLYKKEFPLIKKESSVIEINPQ